MEGTLQKLTFLTVHIHNPHFDDNVHNRHIFLFLHVIQRANLSIDSVLATIAIHQSINLTYTHQQS